MDQIQRILAAREASAVERSHTIKHLGSYTNGQHSFDMLTLTLELRKETSAELMKAIVYHDLPERWLGDMPKSAKGQAPDLTERIYELEAEIDTHMGWTVDLTAEEERWIHAIDRVEFLLWADDQVQMGNRHLEAMLERCYQWFEHNVERCPVVILDFLSSYKWQRTPDIFPS